MEQKQKITQIQQKLNEHYQKELEFYKMKLKLQTRTQMEKQIHQQMITKEIEWMNKIKQKEIDIDKLNQQKNKQAAVVHNITSFL
jgi:hypothetical protein